MVIAQSHPQFSSTSPTLWDPSLIFSSSLPVAQKYALIILNQPLRLHAKIYPQIWTNAHLHIGADGGANRVFRLLKSNQASLPSPSLKLDTVIGDLDSVSPAVRRYWEVRGSKVIHDSDQDSTDFTKAVTYVHSLLTPATSAPGNPTGNSKGKDIVVLGGLGGRVDQGLSVLHHLYKFQSEPDYAKGRMYLLSSEAITFVLQVGHHRIRVKQSLPSPSTTHPSSSSSIATNSAKTIPHLILGPHIGIIPLREPATITTTGLQWDVSNWETAFGGQMSTSNLVREEWVTVQTDKAVLFTIDVLVSGVPDEEEGEEGV